MYASRKPQISLSFENNRKGSGIRDERNDDDLMKMETHVIHDLVPRDADLQLRGGGNPAYSFASGSGDGES